MKIRKKIMVWVAGAGFLTSLVFSLVVFWELREQPVEMMDAQLKTMTSLVARQLGKEERSPDEIKQLLKPFSSERDWIRVYDRNRREVYGSRLSRMVDIPVSWQREGNTFFFRVHVPQNIPDLQPDDEGEITFRVITATGRAYNVPYFIQIAKSVQDLEEETADILVAIGIGLAASTVLLAGLSHLLAGKIVQPIQAINRLANEINEKTLEKRIPLPESRDELFELATHLNNMFDRLQFSFARQKKYLADASHELKTPIAMLRIFFDESMQRSDLPETFLLELDAQGNQVLRMDRLVKTLLELSVLELKSSLDLTPVQLDAACLSVAADFQPLMERKKLGLETDFSGQLLIQGDEEKIRRVLINLVDNAVKYNDENGKIRISISDNQDQVVFSLSNTGPGIPNEDIPKVFDQFYRVDQSRSTEFGGAGLGLSIVKEIVRLHKGAISMASKPGEWTRVEILWPKYDK